jgi:hypothetical protein
MDIFELYKILLVQSIRAPYDFQTFSCLGVERNNYKDLLASKILLTITSIKTPFGNINKEFPIRKVIPKNYNNKKPFKTLTII